MAKPVSTGWLGKGREDIDEVEHLVEFGGKRAVYLGTEDGQKDHRAVRKTLGAFRWPDFQRHNAVNSRKPKVSRFHPRLTLF